MCVGDGGFADFQLFKVPVQRLFVYYTLNKKFEPTSFKLYNF